MRPLFILVCIATLLTLVPAAAEAQQQATATSATAIAPEATAPNGQGPREVPSIVQPSFVLRASAGGEFGVIVGGGSSALHFGGRASLYVGHDLVAGGTRAAPFGLSFGYLGSLVVNHTELLHRHGAALSVRNDMWVATVGGGVTIGHDYTTRSVFTGGHIAVEVGLQWGNFTLTLPIGVDFFPAGRQLVHVFETGLTLGVATN